MVRNRIARVKRDTKRYWRIKCSEGRPFLYYIDPLMKILDGIVKKELKINDLLEEYAAGLTIIPVVYISVS